MDITRHWRLKSHRNQLLATRDPQTNTVTLPQQTASALRDPREQEVYHFQKSVAAVRPEAELAEAAR